MRIFTNEVCIDILHSNSKVTQYDHAEMITNCTPELFFELYEKIKDNLHDNTEKVICLSENPESLIQKIKKGFKIIYAAGGIVSKKNKILFIYRLDKWDLPKGKIEKGEDIETAALREVEEECGVKAKLVNKIGETWHTYHFKGKDILKCTYWFKMLNEDDKQLSPQTEEDIEEVKWVKKEKIRESVLKNTYNSILDIYNRYDIDSN